VNDETGADEDQQEDPKLWQAILDDDREKGVDWALELIQAGAPVNEVVDFNDDVREISPLMSAAMLHDGKLVQALIDAGADINARDGNDYVPLIWALKGENVDNFRLLLSAGADPNPLPSEEGDWSPLLWAAAHENFEDTVNELIVFGVDVNWKNSLGQTALKVAVIARRSGCVRLLLDAGADPTLADNDGYAPIHAAAANGDIEVATMLIEAGVDVNTPLVYPADDEGDTALNSASYAGHYDLARVLVERGACNAGKLINDTILGAHKRSEDPTELVKYLVDNVVEEIDPETILCAVEYAPVSLFKTLFGIFYDTNSICPEDQKILSKTMADILSNVKDEDRFDEIDKIISAVWPSWLCDVSLGLVNSDESTNGERLAVKPVMLSYYQYAYARAFYKELVSIDAEREGYKTLLEATEFLSAENTTLIISDMITPITLLLIWGSPHACYIEEIIFGDESCFKYDEEQYSNADSDLDDSTLEHFHDVTYDEWHLDNSGEVIVNKLSFHVNDKAGFQSAWGALLGALSAVVPFACNNPEVSVTTINDIVFDVPNDNKVKEWVEKLWKDSSDYPDYWLTDEMYVFACHALIRMVAAYLRINSVAVLPAQASPLDLKKFAGLSRYKKMQRSPLWNAVFYENQDTALKLAEHTANQWTVVDERAVSANVRNITPLAKASQMQLPSFLKLLIKEGADINAIDSMGSVPLTYALHAERLDNFRLLIEEGANPDPLNNGEGHYSPLAMAASQGLVEAVKDLIDRGANVNWVGAHGESALKAATENEHMDCAKLLVDAGARQSSE